MELWWAEYIEERKKRDENRDSPEVGQCRKREKKERGDTQRNSNLQTLKKGPKCLPPTLASSHTLHSDKLDTTPQHLRFQ